MSDLPQGWTNALIGELTLPIDKHDPRKSPKAVFEYIDIGGIDGDRMRIQSTKRYSGAEAPSRARQLVRSGDTVLSTVRINLTKTALIPERLDRATASTGFSVLRPSPALLPKFLFHHVTSRPFIVALAKKQTGSSYPAVRDRDVRGMSIDVPPLREQRRIVAAIEEHFSRLDAAEAALRDAARRTEALPNSACMNLTADEGWPVHQLTDLLSSLRNGVFVSRPSADPPGLPILRISAVRPRTLNSKDVRYADPPPDKAERYRLNVGDVLFTRYSGNPRYVGACAVVPPDASGLLHPDKLIRGVVDTAQVDPRWISAYLSVGAGRASIQSRLKTTAGQVGISGRQLKSVEVAVPSLSEQSRRCAEIDRFTELSNRFSEAIGSALQRSAATRRSILGAAFSGQLVPQDPTDEPASVALERIAAERAAEKPTRKRRTAAS